MDTLAKITIYENHDIAEEVLDKAFERLIELEKMFSYTDPDSELSYINSNAYENSVKVSEDMGSLIKSGLHFSELTNGAFDISLGKLIDGSFDGNLSDLGYEHIHYNKDFSTVSFSSEHIKMHFGAIAKGYAVDEIRWLLKEHGIASAMIDIGGEIGMVGLPLHRSGYWKIGITNPISTNNMALTLETDRMALATSGNYERGEHIYDRATGLPAVSDFASVTVVCDNGAFSDALSTAIFVAGEELINLEGICVVTIDKEGKITGYHFRDYNSCSCNIVTDGSYTD
jgi:thiamine biosynthesis lipoprotein